MTHPSAFRYFAREALRDLWERRTVSLLAIATIATSLYLVGLFLLSARGVGGVLGKWGEEVAVSIFLNEGVTPEEILAIRQRLEDESAVGRVEFLDREAARERFGQDFPDLADLPGMLEESPFPASFEVTLKPEYGRPEAVSAFAGGFTGMPGVEDVRFDALWIEKLRSLLRVAGFAGALVGGILLGAAVLTISSVVRMGVYERRDEIEIMRLVGAGPGFIRAPFLIEGAVQGLAGGLAAVCGIGVTWLILNRSIGSLTLSLPDAIFGSFIRPVDAVAILFSGAVLGLAGSLIAGLRE